MRRKLPSIDDGTGWRTSAPDPARPARDPATLPPGRPHGDNNWLGSSFDLAQGLEVKEMESKLSRETLDQLFRS